MTDRDSRTVTWLEARIETAHQDAEAHPEGSGNRAFYYGQAIAYENALSALMEITRLLASKSETVGAA